MKYKHYPMTSFQIGAFLLDTPPSALAFPDTPFVATRGITGVESGSQSCPNASVCLTQMCDCRPPSAGSIGADWFSGAATKARRLSESIRLICCRREMFHCGSPGAAFCP